MTASMSFFQDRSRITDSRLHDALFSNIQLLTYKFKPSEDFQRVFKPDMFKKSNVAAFQQVSYYLLSTLSPDLTKEMISTWPIYEKNQEAKFRKEIMLLIEQINDLYPYADLPKLQHSHYVVPGGTKIAYLMFLLSQLVLLEELKKKDSAILLMSCKGNEDPKVTNLTIKTLKKNTKRQVDIQNIIEEMNSCKEQAVKKAHQMSIESENIEKNLIKNKKRLLKKQANFTGLTLEEVQNQFEQARNNVDSIEKNFSHFFSTIVTICSSLSNGDTDLKYYEELEASEVVVNQIEDNEGRLDIKRLFLYFENSLSQAKINQYSSVELEEIRNLVVDLKKQYLFLQKCSTEQFKELNDIIALFDKIKDRD